MLLSYFIYIKIFKSINYALKHCCICCRVLSYFIKTKLFLFSFFFVNFARIFFMNFFLYFILYRAYIKPKVIPDRYQLVLNSSLECHITSQISLCRVCVFQNRFCFNLLQWAKFYAKLHPNTGKILK